MRLVYHANIDQRANVTTSLYLDSVAFGLHTVADHCVVDIQGAILTARDVALNCDEGWILALAFGHIGNDVCLWLRPLRASSC
jgi:hypothetical protein